MSLSVTTCGVCGTRIRDLCGCGEGREAGQVNKKSGRSVVTTIVAAAGAASRGCAHFVTRQLGRERGDCRENSTV